MLTVGLYYPTNGRDPVGFKPCPKTFTANRFLFLFAAFLVSYLALMAWFLFLLTETSQSTIRLVTAGADSGVYVHGA